MLEQKLRRHDILVDKHILFEFYDQKLPAHIVSTRHFSQWWKDQPANLLNYTPELLQSEHAAHVTKESHPDFWQQGMLSLPLSYYFSPSGHITTASYFDAIWVKAARLEHFNSSFEKD